MKKTFVFCLCLLFLALDAFAGNPTWQQFNLTEFSTNASVISLNVTLPSSGLTNGLFITSSGQLVTRPLLNGTGLGASAFVKTDASTNLVSTLSLSGGTDLVTRPLSTDTNIVGTTSTGASVPISLATLAASFGGGSSGISIGSTNGTTLATGLTTLNLTNYFKVPHVVGSVLTLDLTPNLFDTPVTTFSGTTFDLGAAETITTGSAITFSGTVGNAPPSGTERWGQLTVLATADIVVTTSAIWHASDYTTTRTITNGNTAVISLDVILGTSTNVAIVQFK